MENWLNYTSNKIIYYSNIQEVVYNLDARDPTKLVKTSSQQHANQDCATSYDREFAKSLRMRGPGSRRDDLFVILFVEFIMRVLTLSQISHSHILHDKTGPKWSEVV